MEMDLSVINSIAILIIIIVVFINFITSMYNYRQTRDNRAEIIKLNNDIADYIDYLEGAIKAYVKKSLEYQTQNILDLNEFKDLDPQIKVLYKNHIVNELMPALTASINDMYLKNKDKITDADISAAIKKMISDLRASQTDESPVETILKTINNIDDTQCWDLCKKTVGCTGTSYNRITKTCTLVNRK